MRAFGLDVEQSALGLNFRCERIVVGDGAVTRAGLSLVGLITREEVAVDILAVVVRIGSGVSMVVSLENEVNGVLCKQRNKVLS